MFTRLTFDAGLQVEPVWSPDSTEIVYMSKDKGLFMRHADGTGAPEQLLQDPYVRPAAWSADGQLIFEDNHTGSFDIGVLALTGDHRHHYLLATTSNEERSALSPDGRRLAYQSDEGGRYEIYVRPFPNVDAGMWQISADGGEEPRWSRDGRTLFFLGPTHLMAATIGSGDTFAFGAPRVVLSRAGYSFDSPSPNYDVSPDGQRFLFLKPAPQADADTKPARIVVVTNWLEELTRSVPTE